MPLDYFLKNTKDDSQEDADKNQASQKSKDVEPDNDGGEGEIIGTCLTMCPEDEERLRIQENMVHVLEKVGTDLKLVKSYSRSAADSKMEGPQQLRPFNILQVTVIYLLFGVTKRTDVSTAVMYDFINDRLRAVRKDMIIQRMSPRDSAHLLEPMIRFYVYYGYRLHGLPLKDFDPVLHKKYLLECQKWFLTCCDTAKDLKYDDEHLTPQELSELMITMNIANGLRKLAFDQLLMECLYILCNVDDIHPLQRYVNLPVLLKRRPKLKLAYSIAYENRKGNFVKVAKMMKTLCPLAHCAMCQYLPELQRNGLKVMTRAYCNYKQTVPASIIKQWLAFSSEAEALAACQHYGLSVVDGQVRFETGALNTDGKMHESNIRLMKGKLNLNLRHVFTYTTKPTPLMALLLNRR